MFYNNGKSALLKNDMDAVTIKAILLAPAYTQNIDTHIFLDDISANRAATTTDETLTLTFTTDNATDTIKVDSGNIIIDNLTTSVNAIAVYISTGVESTSELLFYVGLGATLAPVDGTLTINVNSAGLFTI